MGHLLKKQIVMAFLCLSLTMKVPEARKEDLEKAAELAVERAAERAAERAVEKALEAGNTSSTTVTVKESYSNARKTAEEQAAPGSESTRYNAGKTSVFESKDFPEPSGYDSPMSGPDYSDYNDTRYENDYDDSREFDNNESRGYNDYNDSRGHDYENDYDDANDTRSEKEDDDYSGKMDTKGFHVSESADGYRNQDSKDPSDYDESPLGDAEDYTFPKDTDYQKLNTSKTGNSEISEPFGDFDSDFGSKLTNTDAKLPDSSLEDDLKFDSPETDFLKKKDSKKQDIKEDETEYKDDDNWKSYSDWQKDFKNTGDETFPNGSFWDDDDETLKIWSEEEDVVPSGSKKTEAQAKSQRSLTPNFKKKQEFEERANEKPSNDKEIDFSSQKSWQPNDDIDDNEPAADALVESDTSDESKSSKENANFYRRRDVSRSVSSSDGNFYRRSPVYIARDIESEEDTSTERVTTTTTKSPISRFRKTYRDRARIQYQKIAGRSSENSRRPIYNFEKTLGSKFHNFSDERERDSIATVKWPYRINLNNQTAFEFQENYNPYKEISTTSRSYPKSFDDKMVTKGPMTHMTPSNPTTSTGLSSTPGNLPGNLQKIFKRPSLVQLPPKLPTIQSDVKNFPHIPSSVLTAPKSNPKEVITMVYPHPYDTINFQMKQENTSRQNQQQLNADSEIPVFINTALPGPFQVAKQSTVQSNKPYAIHLDKSIPIALKRRIPFIVQFPLKPYEKQLRPEGRLIKFIENDSTVSENRLRKNRLSVA